MGCTSSQVPDPNITFGQRTAGKPEVRNGKLPNRTQHKQNGVKSGHEHVIQNGHLANGDAVSVVTTSTSVTSGVDLVVDTNNCNGSDTISVTPLLMEPTRTLRGDQSQRQEARISRELRLNDMHKIREQKAMKISERVTEEKERLSLSTFANSQATSRSGSPRTLHKGGFMRPGTSTQVEPIIVSCVPKSASEESLHSDKPDDVARPSALKSTNSRRRKGEPKVRIVTDDMNQSQNSSKNDKDGVNNKEVIMEKQIPNKDNLL